jgi:hypothetical protein
MMPQYHALEESGLCEPIIVIVDDRAIDLAEKLRSDGIRVEMVSEELRQDPLLITEKRFQECISRLPKVLAAILRSNAIAHSFLIDGWRCQTVVRLYKKSLQAWLRYLEKNRIDLAMVPGDRELGAFPPLLKACKLMQIPVVISTSNIPTRDSLAANRVGEKKFKANFAQCPPLWNMLIRLRFPQQVAERDFGIGNASVSFDTNTSPARSAFLEIT